MDLSEALEASWVSLCPNTECVACKGTRALHEYASKMEEALRAISDARRHECEAPLEMVDRLQGLAAGAIRKPGATVEINAARLELDGARLEIESLAKEWRRSDEARKAAADLIRNLEQERDRALVRAHYSDDQARIATCKLAERQELLDAAIVLAKSHEQRAKTAEQTCARWSAATEKWEKRAEEVRDNNPQGKGEGSDINGWGGIFVLSALRAIRAASTKEETSTVEHPEQVAESTI